MSHAEKRRLKFILRSLNDLFMRMIHDCNYLKDLSSCCGQNEKVGIKRRNQDVS